MEANGNNESNSELINLLKKYNQENILSYYLSEKNKQKLVDFEKSIRSIDFELLNKLFIQSKTETIKNSFDTNSIKVIDEKLTIEKQCKSKDDVDYRKIGEENIYQGKVCLLILAGGQGSRLNFEHPKGMYSVDMPSGKSLFAYLFTRFLSIQNIIKNKYENNKIKIENLKFSTSKILIQTSEDNHEETINYLKSNKYFGLNEEDVIIFPQDMISSMDINGNLVLSTNKELFRNPNGNGGCFTTLKRNKILEKCLNLGIDILNVISVDNPINKVLDPMYIGYHIYVKSLFSAKYTPKLHANEPCGVYVYYNQSPIKIEYLDFPKELLEIKENEKLKFSDACILNYLIDIKELYNILESEENLNSLNEEYHYAKRKVNCFNSLKNQSEIIEIFKFELFFNSIIKFFKRVTLFEVLREECFAPVKNSQGESSPETCRSGISKMFFNYLNNMNFEFVEKMNGNLCKISIEKLLLEIDFSLIYDNCYQIIDSNINNISVNGYKPQIIDGNKIVLETKDLNESGVYKLYISLKQ